MGSEQLGPLIPHCYETFLPRSITLRSCFIMKETLKFHHQVISWTLPSISHSSSSIFCVAIVQYQAHLFFLFLFKRIMCRCNFLWWSVSGGLKGKFSKAVWHFSAPQFKSITLWSSLRESKEGRQCEKSRAYSLMFALLFGISFPLHPAIPRPGGMSPTAFP